MNGFNPNSPRHSHTLARLMSESTGSGVRTLEPVHAAELAKEEPLTNSAWRLHLVGLDADNGEIELEGVEELLITATEFHVELDGMEDLSVRTVHTVTREFGMAWHTFRNQIERLSIERVAMTVDLLDKQGHVALNHLIFIEDWNMFPDTLNALHQNAQTCSILWVIGEDGVIFYAVPPEAEEDQTPAPAPLSVPDAVVPGDIISRQ